MSEEGFEEWDAEFLDQLIQLEELALSSSSSSSSSAAIPNPNPNFSQSLFPPPPLLHQQRREPPPSVAASSRREPTSYSPPRELSQRTAAAFDSFPRSSNGATVKCAITSSPPPIPNLRLSEADKELEIECLKRELGRVSKLLSDLEQECSELRKERDKKHGQLNYVSSKNEVKDEVLCNLKSTNLDRECGALGVEHPRISQLFQNVESTSKRNGPKIDIGIQTDNAGVFSQVFSNELLTCQDLSKKLLAIWDFPSKQISGRNLISNLLVACQTDLHFLFGCMGMNLSVKSRKGSPACESSNRVLQYHLHSCHTLEAAKVSHLYSVLTKVNNGTVQLEALVEPLLDLCNLENIDIVHRSIRILHMFLKHFLSFERKSGERDFVMFDGFCSGNNIPNPHGSRTATKRDMNSISKDETSNMNYLPVGTKFSDDTLFKKREQNPGFIISVSRIDWVSLFKVMFQIAMRYKEEFVRLEAVSVLNAILMRSNPYTDREEFGNAQVFEGISQLLRKEAGLQVQRHSIQLLYLLLNCPKLLITFCSGCMEGEATPFMNDTTEDTEDASAFQKFSCTLQGLADCVACSANGLEELKLRRNVIVLLAFLASSGKSGFDILVGHKLSKDANFLMLILQVLVSEMDIEATSNRKSPEIFKERTLLMREALILLNRLVSNPAYSGIALQLLTKSRDMASLTIDIANRLSRKDQTISCQFDDIVRMMKESEVVDLARVFKRRVFSYMGDHIA